jgi:hypothetical protein
MNKIMQCAGALPAFIVMKKHSMTYVNRPVSGGLHETHSEIFKEGEAGAGKPGC